MGLEYFTKDFWVDHVPGAAVVKAVAYSTDWYTQRAVGIIGAAPVAQPLWLHLPYQAVHAPYTPPPTGEGVPWNPSVCAAAGNATLNPTRALCTTFGSMLHEMDAGIARVVGALRNGGRWESTLLIFSADNGAPSTRVDPGNNFPLYGQKNTPWEGGSRAAAMLAGGFLPARLHGTRSPTFVHVADWYATLAALAGVEPSDKARTWHEIDGLNMWPLLTAPPGANTTSPRVFLPLSTNVLLYRSRWKLVTHAPASVRTTSNNTRSMGSMACGKTAADPRAPPCLFDILADPWVAF